MGMDSLEIFRISEVGRFHSNTNILESRRDLSYYKLAA